MPRHVAIIMDGNGRWARQRGLARSEGHKAGTEAAKNVVMEARTLGVEFLTLYTFSRENWSRPKEEVQFLFDLLVAFLRRELPSLLEQSIRLNILGEQGDLPFSVRQVLGFICAKTASCRAMTLNLALNYSGREDILRACRQLLQDGVAPDALTMDAFQSRLYTSGQPDPDLIIRTSGEHRLSNYLLFQSAYSELYFTSVLWPDFSPEEFRKALADYGRRQRRFGKTDEQIRGGHGC